MLDLSKILLRYRLPDASWYSPGKPPRLLANLDVDQIVANLQKGDLGDVDEKTLRSIRFELDKRHRALHRERPETADEWKLWKEARSGIHQQLMDLNSAISRFEEQHRQIRWGSLQDLVPGPVPEVYKAYYLTTDFKPEEMIRVLEIARELESGQSPLLSRHNEVTPVAGAQIWKAKMQLLDEAAKKPIRNGKPVEVDLEYYELSSPQLIGKLREALKAGAKVRVLVDPGKLETAGSLKIASSIASRLRTLNLLTQGISRANLGIAFFPNAKVLSNQQDIMHRKIFRVGDTVIFGGMNGNVGSGEDVDLGFVLRGEAARRLVEVYQEDISLSLHATARDMYGDQIEQIRRNDSIVLDREGLVSFLESLVPIEVREGEPWKERATKVLGLAERKGYPPRKLFVIDPAAIPNLRPESPLIHLTQFGRKLLADHLSVISKSLEEARNQQALADIEIPNLVVGEKTVAVASSKEERQALILYAIHSADRFIKIPAFVLTKHVAAALTAKKAEMERQGKPFDIQITMDPGLYQPGGFNPNESTFVNLQELGIPIRWVALVRSTNEHDRKLHAKMMLTDKLVLTGSTNFSLKGLRGNWELTGAWIFDEKDAGARKELEKYFDRLYGTASLAPDLPAMAAKRYVNYQEPDRDLIMSEYGHRKLRHFLHVLQQFEEETGAWLDQFQRNPENKAKIDHLVAEGYHRGFATLLVAGNKRLKYLRENTPAWKRIHKEFILQGR